MECVLGGLAVHCSKANKQARLVENKVCFISVAGTYVVEGWQTAVRRPTAPTDKQRVKAFIDRVRDGGATCRNSVVISNSHIQIGHWWSDQHYLECFRYS